MNLPAPSSSLILVVNTDPVVGEALVADLESILEGCSLPDAPSPAIVRLVDGAEQTLRLAKATIAAGGIVPVVFVERTLSSGRGVDVLLDLHEDPDLIAVRKILVTSKASLLDVDEALNRGAVHGMITRPWTRFGLGEQLEAQLATYLVEHAPERVEDFVGLLDGEDLSKAAARVEERKLAPSGESESTHLILDHEITNQELEDRLVAALDRALGHPPRLRVGPGTILIEEGDDVGGIYVVLDGTVRLSSKTTTGTRVLHERSTGSIVGLLSLASHRRAMLRCRAMTEVRAIPITLHQLAKAMDSDPEVLELLTRVLIGSLARRLRRSDELQVELDQSLAALSEARASLVASARRATLGDMAAGMAHELNNPVAALSRAVEHLQEDMIEVIESPSTKMHVNRAIMAEPPSAAEARRAKATISKRLGDRSLADTLVEAGILDVDAAVELVGHGREGIRQVRAASRLGRSLRNATSAAERIGSLVKSLGGYVRGGDGQRPMIPDLDVTEGVENALRLVAHRIGGVSIERNYEPVPLITARPGALQQVWTNFLINALDAMGDGEAPIDGVIGVEVMRLDQNTIRVAVTDSGPGIPEALQSKIFEPKFTTKDGRVKFGLGLGLSIAAQIVDEHHGQIALSSRPGHTVFSVELPIGRSPDVGQIQDSQEERLR